MSDEAGVWFVNRGLFSDHFLQSRLPEWKEWGIDAELALFREGLQSLYDSKKSILPRLNEAQTEIEFVQPVLDLLGYANRYIVQVPTKIGQRTNRPDYALFPDVETKNKAYKKLPGVSISVDTELCTGCGICADICFAAEMRIEDGVALVGDDCKGCARCVTACPEGAITLVTDDLNTMVTRLLERVDRVADLG